jgi:NAD(P)-dependent dehydrogenase (short-subunit alcohol dehydrogenase family)
VTEPIDPTTLTVGVLGGTGAQGKGLALRWAKAGISVIIGSRAAERAETSAAEYRELTGTDNIRGADNATCAAEAEGQRWLSIAAFAYHHHGKNAYEAGDFETARESFKQSLFLRREAGAEDRELETVLLAIEAAERRRTAQLVAG